MQSKDERIFRAWKASRHASYAEDGRFGSPWMVTARRWRMPIREIMAAVARYREQRDSRIGGE